MDKLERGTLIYLSAADMEKCIKTDLDNRYDMGAHKYILFVTIKKGN